jgi:hypothetical protein
MLGAMFSGRHNVKVDEKASFAESQADLRANCLVVQSAIPAKWKNGYQSECRPKLLCNFNSSYIEASHLVFSFSFLVGLSVEPASPCAGYSVS